MRLQRAGGWERQVKQALRNGLPLFKAPAAAKQVKHKPKPQLKGSYASSLRASTAGGKQVKHEPKPRGTLKAATVHTSQHAKSVASSAKSVASATLRQKEEAEVSGAKSVASASSAAQHAEAKEKAVLEERWSQIKQQESKMEEEEAAALATANTLRKQVRLAHTCAYACCKGNTCAYACC